MFKKLKINESKQKGYLYITKHGLGPGTLPKGVNVLREEELDNYLTVFWTDRFLTTKELNDYDIYPETMNNKLLSKYGKTYDSFDESCLTEYDKSDIVSNELSEDDLWAACSDISGLEDISETDTPNEFIFTYTNSMTDQMYEIREDALISALNDFGYTAEYVTNNGNNVIVLNVTNNLSESYSVTTYGNDTWIRFVDVDGAFGNPGDVVTYQELKDYWNENKDSDPILSEYDTFME